MQLRSPDGMRPNVAVSQRYFDVGGIARVGVPGRLGLIGLSMTGDNEEPGNRLVVADSGVIRDIGPVPTLYTSHKIARLNLLLGVRDIQFERRTGLDALTATQDVPLGVQLGMQLGRSMPMLGAAEEDLFLAGDLYVGLSHSPHTTTRLQLQGEGRRVAGETAWDGVLTTGRLTHQVMITPSQLDLFALEWAGGFQQRTPFQLLLGVPEGGVRGYENANLPGGQRHRRARGAPLHVRHGDAAGRRGIRGVRRRGPPVGGRRSVRRHDAGEELDRHQPAGGGPTPIGADVASGFCRADQQRGGGWLHAPLHEHRPHGVRLPRRARRGEGPRADDAVVDLRVAVTRPASGQCQRLARSINRLIGTTSASSSAAATNSEIAVR